MQPALFTKALEHLPEDLGADIWKNVCECAERVVELVEVWIFLGGGIFGLRNGQSPGNVVVCAGNQGWRFERR